MRPHRAAAASRARATNALPVAGGARVLAWRVRNAGLALALAACLFASSDVRAAAGGPPSPPRRTSPSPIVTTARNVEDACARVPPDWADLATLLQRLTLLQKDDHRAAQVAQLDQRVPRAVARALEADFRRLVLLVGTAQMDGPRRALQAAQSGWRATNAHCEQAVAGAAHRAFANRLTASDDTTLVQRTLALCQETDLDVDAVLEGLAARCAAGENGTCLRIAFALVPYAFRPGTTGTMRHGLEEITERLMRDGAVRSVFELVLRSPGGEAVAWLAPFAQRVVDNGHNEEALRSPRGAEFLDRANRDLRVDIPVAYWIGWPMAPLAIQDQCAAGRLTDRGREALEALVQFDRWDLLSPLAEMVTSEDLRLWLRDSCIAQVDRLREANRLADPALQAHIERAASALGFANPYPRAPESSRRSPDSDSRELPRPTGVVLRPDPDPTRAPAGGESPASAVVPERASEWRGSRDWRTWDGQYALCDLVGKAGTRWLDSESDRGLVGADLVVDVVRRDLFVRGGLDYLQQLGDVEATPGGRWEQWRLVGALDRGLAPGFAMGVRPAIELYRVRMPDAIWVFDSSGGGASRRWRSRYAVELPLRFGTWFGEAPRGRWLRLGLWAGPRIEVPEEGLGENRWQAIAGGDLEVRVDGEIAGLVVRAEAHRLWDREIGRAGTDEAVALGRLLFGWPSFKIGPEARVIAAGDLLGDPSRARTEGVVSLVFGARLQPRQ